MYLPKRIVWKKYKCKDIEVVRGYFWNVCHTFIVNIKSLHEKWGWGIDVGEDGRGRHG